LNYPEAGRPFGKLRTSLSGFKRGIAYGDGNFSRPLTFVRGDALCLIFYSHKNVFFVIFPVGMKTEVLNWTEGNQERIVRSAVRTLDNGGIVAIPTETVYGLACRAEPKTIQRLDEIKARAEGKRYSLHIGKPGDIHRYVPHFGARAKALIRKGLPGPITLVCELSEQDLEEQKKKLGQEVFSILYDNGTIGIRCPDNEAAVRILSETVWPIVAPSANPSGQEPATTAQQAIAYFDGQIEMVIDGGAEACRYQKSSTVVKISATGIEVLREGVLSKEDIEHLSTVRIAFVCTGNTCRSPMAQAFAAKYTANKISCNVDSIEAFGYIIESFGISAYDGCPASQEAVKVLQDKGLSINNHRSRLLRRQDIRQSDRIFVMSRHHLDAVLAMDKDARERIFLLDSRDDIPDPMGLGATEYLACAERIEQAVKERMKDIL
jgi:protein-tyrosine phosphatase